MTGFEEVKHAVEIEQAILHSLSHLYQKHPDIFDVLYNITKRQILIRHFEFKENSFCDGLLDWNVFDGLACPILKHYGSEIPFQSLQDFIFSELESALKFPKFPIKDTKKGKKITFRKPRIWDRI